MQSIDIFPAVIFGIIGLALIVYFLKIILGSLFSDSGSWIEKYRIKQKESLLPRVDLYIKAGDFEQANQLLRDAFYFGGSKGEGGLIERGNNHNLAILGRVIHISERLSTHLDNLPIVEDLLLTRAQLIKTFAERKLSQAALRKKRRSEKGGAEQSWAALEFSKQLDELRDKIQTNQKSLESQLARLFAALGGARKRDEVTYH